MPRGSELIGRLHFKEGHDLYHWRPGWFALAGSALHFGAGQRGGEEAVLQLKRLQELSENRRKNSRSESVCSINDGN